MIWLHIVIDFALDVFWYLLGFILLPALVCQGLYVRKTTEILPEAEGPRTGKLQSLQNEKTLRLLVIGDSAAAGVGALSQSEALLGNLLTELESFGFSNIHWQLEATSGHALSAEMLHFVQSKKFAESARSGGFDVVVVAGGVNDVKDFYSVHSWKRGLTHIARALHGQNIPTVIYSGLPPMHDFPALPQPLRFYLGIRARHFDFVLASWCKRTKGVHYAPTPPRMERDEQFMSRDGFHPGPVIYARWAQAIAATIRETL